MEIRAYAKINIGLQIVRKRDDGYHDIDSVFHRIDLYDTLTFERTQSGISLSCSDPAIPANETNLCAAAARALFDAAGYSGGADIDLEKRIPSGAGLGGGSADAAATLRALNALCGLHAGPETLRSIAASLGADVPYFLEDGSAYAKGIGDMLTYFHLPLPYHIVLVHPGIHIPTPWAYGRFRFNPSLPIIDLQKTLLDNLDNPLAWVNKIRNDFESVVFTEYEDIMRIKEVLYRTGAAFALMSGSGSAVYGFYPSAEYADDAAAFFGKKYAVWTTAAGFQPEADRL